MWGVFQFQPVSNAKLTCHSYGSPRTPPVPTATEVRISEENKTQRSACLAAVAKRVVEEHQQTEREKIAAQCSTRREEIAAEVGCDRCNVEVGE